MMMIYRVNIWCRERKNQHSAAAAGRLYAHTPALRESAYTHTHAEESAGRSSASAVHTAAAGIESSRDHHPMYYYIHITAAEREKRESYRAI